MRQSCSSVIRQLGKTHKERTQFYRFLSNKRVRWQSLLSEATSSLHQACAGKEVLLVQDSSELSFGRDPIAKDLHPVGDGSTYGFFAHPVIALDGESGGVLGLADVRFWRRKVDDPATPKLSRWARYLRPFEEKERVVWLSSAQAALACSAGAKRHTIISDREADIYEVHAGLSEQAHILTRAASNRKLAGQPLKLFDYLAQRPFVGQYQVDLPATDQRSAHKASLQIKWAKVHLARPERKKRDKLPSEIELYAIEVLEAPQSVVNQEQPLHWYLLTSHRIEHLDQAYQIVQWYRERWKIEQLFRTLKTQGLDLQTSQLRQYDRLAKLAVMTLIAAVKIIQLVYAREGKTQQKLADAFSHKEQAFFIRLGPTLEGNTAKLRNPHPPDALAFASWVIARLGGWSGYQSERPPGPITLKNGLKKFYAMFEGAELFLR